MGIVHVSHLKARTLTRQTAGAQSRKAALVGDFGQRVGLIHELAERVRAEERVDNRRYGLRVDEIDGSEHLIVAYVHTLADSTRHARETHTELVVELLAHSAHAAVAEVVDIVDVGLRVDKLDKILDDGDDVFLREDFHVHRRPEVEFLVYAVASHLSEVVALLAEEQVGDDFAGTCLIRRLRVAQRTVDELHCLLFGVGRILLQRVEDNRIVARSGVLLVQKDILHAAAENFVDMAFLNYCLAVDNHIVSLDAHDFAGVLVHKVLNPCFKHARSKLAAHGFLKICLVDFDFLCQTEYFDDVFVAFQTDSSQQCCHREFFLSVDVSVHDIVDVSGKLYPRTAERDDTRRV